MRIGYQHKLSREEAYERINAFLVDYQKEHTSKRSDPKTSWNPEHTKIDYRWDMRGLTIQTKVTLEEGQIILEGKFPFFRLSCRKGEVEERVRMELEKLLS
ncbi:MAG: polyhydroxyalkanoic acid system family protein [Nanoarchaeota archaeon]|nr:polyhydroxyalkanoic acid system family protein [Nanoarchaeota archaeon]